MHILKRHIKTYRLDIFFAVISVMVMAGATLLQPRLLQEILKAIMASDQDTVNQYGIALIAVACVGLIGGILNTIFAARAAQGIAADLREEAYQKVQSFSLSNIEKFSTGHLVVRLTNDVWQVQSLIMMSLQSLARIPILFIGAFILAITTLPKLWWVMILMIVCIILASQILFKRMGKYFGRVQKLIDRINTIAKENLQGIRVVKSFNQENNQQQKFDHDSDNLTQLNTTIGYLFSAMFPGFMLIANLAITVAIYFVSLGVASHPQDLAAIPAFVTYLMQVLFAIMIGGMISTFASRGLVALRRIGEVLQTTPDLIDENVNDMTIKGDIAFEDVSFQYPESNDTTLKNISFNIKPGEMVGIVGATGSGKTTLAQLIGRLYDPTHGNVLIDQVNLKNISQESLRRGISYVLQRAILFSGTIAENLRQGKQDATLTEMQKAADIAQASEFINRYDDQFEHLISERSANLSGGQKQRLSIARGVIGQPKILILDDSTSALDARSEKLVQDALATHLKDTTTIVIAEKISSVRHADRILVLDNGRLVGNGPHETLLKESAVYREIFETQRAKEI